MKLSEELQARGFMHQISCDSLAEIVDGDKRVVYHGIDPTADSAHAGNFVQWILLKHLHDHGHKVIFLVGGGTGRIGDPKPDAERELATHEEINSRVEKLKVQAQHLLGSTDIMFVDNYDWLREVGLVDFLRDIGKHFTVNELMKKDAIATRLSSEVGLSYTEFAYPLLQAFDYLELHRRYGCNLQVGGSDQWGNIVAGVDLVRRVEGQKVYALTQALVIDKATGKKFGKSEGNAVWLDAEKTSPYQFYQFWLNVSDDSVVDFLKRFTFLSLEEIAGVEQDFMRNPGDRLAQKRLAYEVTAFVHGKEVVDNVVVVSEILFGDRSVDEITTEVKDLLLTNAPTTNIQSGTTVLDVLVESGLASSKREARMFIESGAVLVNDEKVTSTDMLLDDSLSVQGLVFLRRGKKRLSILCFE